MDLLLENDTVMDIIKPHKVKLSRFRGEKIKKKMQDMIKETATEMECWDEWSQNTRKAAEKICGISRGSYKPNVTWWWNDEVKEAIKEKKLL